MLEFKNVCVSIKGKKIIDDISFTAKCGEITTLIGLNGSGKTTLLSSALNGHRYTGEILANGISVSSISRRELAKRISFMPQVLPSPNISTEALVSFGRSPHTSFSGILSPEDRQAVSIALKEMNIEHLSQRRVSTLSGGERQRAFFAMLLAQGTDIVMADEPTTYMDAHAKRELLSFLLSLKERGRAVITVLHDINDAIAISDKICLIDAGKLIFSGSAYEFAHSDLPHTVFGLIPVKVLDGDKEEIIFR